jgi:hypothetical protein
VVDIADFGLAMSCSARLLLFLVLVRLQHYSNHDIVTFLESIGASFGACQNAYTSAGDLLLLLLLTHTPTRPRSVGVRACTYIHVHVHIAACAISDCCCCIFQLLFTAYQGLHSRVISNGSVMDQ